MITNRNLFELRQWGSIEEIETKKRIMVLMHAYHYEILGESVISDHDYDRLAYSIDLSISTSRPDLDAWFRANYVPDTGLWIHKYPDLKGIRMLIERLASHREKGLPHTGVFPISA